MAAKDTGTIKRLLQQPISALRHAVTKEMPLCITVILLDRLFEKDRQSSSVKVNDRKLILYSLRKLQLLMTESKPDTRIKEVINWIEERTLGDNNSGPDIQSLLNLAKDLLHQSVRDLNSLRQGYSDALNLLGPAPNYIDNGIEVQVLAYTFYHAVGRIDDKFDQRLDSPHSSNPAIRAMNILKLVAL